jgi:hypothetical protein
LSFEIYSVGDISFEGYYSDNPQNDLFSSVINLFKAADIVIANLENPLLEMNQGTPVSGKCTLRGCTGWADVIKGAGISLVSLANNHMMDYGEEGLSSTLEALERVGLHYVGAGKNYTDANKPLYLDINGNKVAVLARSSVVVASSSYAGDNIPGVAYLDVDETLKNLSACKKIADYVILIMHWGIEEYDYPSPEQRKLAKKIIDSGADIILGHHPHVIQGAEKMKNGFVHYSSGNFLFNEFNWSFINMDGESQETISRLSKKNREGMILDVEFKDAQIIFNSVHTRINSSGDVVLDDTRERKKEFEKLCRRLHWPGYRFGWRLYAAHREFVLRILPLVKGKFTWEKIKKIRPGHFKQLFFTLKRSLKITSEKSTNPYE